MFSDNPLSPSTLRTPLPSQSQRHLPPPFPKSYIVIMSSIEQLNIAGNSRLERLPEELLRKILTYVALNRSENRSDQYQGTTTLHTNSRNKSLTTATTERSQSTKISQPATSLPCILASKTLHMTALPVMYRDITTSLPSTFTKFLAQIRCHQQLGKYVRSLDLSPVSNHTPRFENEVLVNPIPGLLHLTPLLREFRIGQTIQDHLDGTVLQQLFCELPRLESIDLSQCSTPNFVWEFSKLSLQADFQVSNSIVSLNLSRCVGLASSVFSVILPQLPRLQVLNAANTYVTSEALLSIPSTARLTHLDLENCDLLSGAEIVKFLTIHPSATTTLEYLNLNTSSSRNTYLAEEDVRTILSRVASTLRFLHLKNSTMTPAHVPLLRYLAGQVQELTVGSHISMADLEAIFVVRDEHDVSAVEQLETEDETRNDSKYQTILDPMVEAVAICRLRQRINSTSSACSDTSVRSKLRMLDISSMEFAQQGKVRLSVLLGPQSGMLERIMVAERVLRKGGLLKRVCRAVGWDVGRAGESGWIRRRG